MKKSLIGYGLLSVLIVVFGLLWMEIGDLVGAFLSFIVLVLGVGLLVAVIGYFVSNAPAWSRRFRGVSWENHLKLLETSGKAVREEYQATRALTAEALHTSSIIHFIDIGEGNILCLYGQQYFDFEPITDDPEINQPRQFPTKDFSLLRHVKKGDVLSLFPGSAVLEPTICGPISKPYKLFDLGLELRDGEIVTGSSLNAVERAIQGAR